MDHYDRVFTTSEKVIPFSEIKIQGDAIKLVSGTDQLWDKIEIYEPEHNLICNLERNSVSGGSLAETKLARIKDSIRDCYPTSAREWLTKYFSTIKTIYTFQLFPTNITKNGWPVLGRIQNLLKDLLNGIIQADKEGFYNHEGDFILWQMYQGASGTIHAATLDDREQWVSYRLSLNDVKAIELFKQGTVPKKSFFSRLFKGA
jgi:hypothetical protein